MMFDPTSNILIAFTHTLLHSLWIGAVILAVVQGSFLLINERRSTTRYLVAVSGLVTFFAAMITLFVGLYHPFSPSPGMAISSEMISAYLSGSKSGVTGSGPPGAFRFYPMIIQLYFAGTLLLSIRWWIGNSKLRSIIRMAKPADQQIKLILGHLQEKLNITRNIRLLISTRISSPMLYGYLKPVIIVPAGMLFHLSNDQVEAILIHEIIHLKKIDFLVNLLQTFFEIIFFFNPFIWAISSHIRNEREKRCDDHVIRSGMSPMVYAKALLNLSISGSPSPEPSIHADGNNRNQLLNRIQRLLNINTMKTKSKQKALLSSLVIAGAMIIFISSGFSTPFLTIEKGGNKHTMKSEIPVPVTVSPEIIDNSQVSELSLEIIENFQKDLLAQDTIKKDQIKSMSDEEWKIYKENLEKSQEVLKNIDWAAKQEEFEKNKQEMISQMAMNIEENKVRLQEDMRRLEEEMKSIDKDKIRQQLEKARQEVDSLRENFDLEKFEKEFEKAMQEMDIAKQKMESMLQDSLKLGKEIEMAIQSGMKALQELNIEEMMEDLRISMEGIDIDFDFDFDSDFDFDAIPEFNFNLDSIMIETQKAVEAIDFEEIRRSMDEALHEMEAEMKEMEKERNEKKEQK